MRGGFFDLLERIVSLGFNNEIPLGVGVQPDDEVRLIIMHLAVVEIGNGESQPRILHEGPHGFMGINIIGRRLFPFFGIRHEVIDV